MSQTLALLENEILVPERDCNVSAVSVPSSSKGGIGDTYYNDVVPHRDDSKKCNKSGNGDDSDTSTVDAQEEGSEAEILPEKAETDGDSNGEYSASGSEDDSTVLLDTLRKKHSVLELKYDNLIEAHEKKIKKIKELQEEINNMDKIKEKYRKLAQVNTNLEEEKKSLKTEIGELKEMNWSLQRQNLRISPGFMSCAVFYM